MSLMTSTATPNSPEFQRNREAYELRIDDLHERRARALIGGPEKARLLHKNMTQTATRLAGEIRIAIGALEGGAIPATVTQHLRTVVQC